MASVDLIGSNVMDIAAALLNDPARTNYTYVAQAPYLRLALQELRELFELNNVPVTQKVTSPPIQVNAGVTEIVFNGVAPVPSLPDDFVEAQQLWERARGIDPYTPMTHKDFLPHQLEGVSLNQLIYWVWDGQSIKFLPSTSNNDVKMDYIRQLFPDAGAVIDHNTPINVVNAATFLEYRTASLCAEFIERNNTSADGLNQYAILGLDRVHGISAKGKQNIQTRRRPFRAGYKRRGWVT